MSTSGSVLGDMHTFKCFDNGPGRTPGLAMLMPGGKVTSFPEAYGLTASQCALLCLKRNTECISFSYYDGLCFLRNVSLAQPGLVCGIPVPEGRLRCPAGRIGDVFIAYGGANRRMMECMCGANNNMSPEWSYLSAVSRYNCVDNCGPMRCFLKLSETYECWLCNGDYNYCTPFRDSSPTYPQRIVCMPLN